MFNIGNYQFECLSRAYSNYFYLRLENYLRTEMPDRINDQTFTQTIPYIVTKAKSYGLRSERIFAQLACLTLEFGIESVEKIMLRLKDEKDPDLALQSWLERGTELV